jgi:deoxyribonuclease V
MIASVDVHYKDDATATVAAVVFSDFSDSEAYRTYTMEIQEAEEYLPGQFFRRELPCIISILGIIEEEIDTIIIDGYVDLGEGPGLGQHLWISLECKKKVIGVAKTHFRGANPARVFRGKSRKPLFVSAAGIEQSAASDLISGMHGKYRIPTLIKQADSLSRYGMPANSN